MRITATASPPYLGACHPSRAELVRLPDGSSVTIRHAGAANEPAMRASYAARGPEETVEFPTFGWRVAHERFT
jgi:hypothetical protein